MTYQAGRLGQSHALSIRYDSPAPGSALAVAPTPGDDILDGTPGADTIDGLEGNDTIRGLAGNDTLYGGLGADILQGGLGDDLLDGGAHTDTASYTDATSAVTVSLALSGAQNTIGAGTDTLIAIENLLGSNYNDILTGNAGNNRLTGGNGSDTLEGGAGNDILDGGAHTDTATYEHASAGVTVSLAIAGAQNTVGAGMDTLIGIERLIGSAFDDKLTGGNGDDKLEGGAGNDTLSGGNGFDFVRYVTATSGVTVDLSAIGAQNTVGAGIDTLVSIENITGSSFGDVLTGTTGDNVLNGGDGIDTVRYSDATAAVTVNLNITDAQSTGGAGADTLLGIENLTGSAFDDNLTGDSGNNILNGAGGADMLAGGLGNDIYYVDNAGDTVVEAASAGNDLIYASASYTLTAQNVETLSLIGAASISATGNASGNRLNGNSGNNILTGLAGDDILSGGNGADIVSGGAGNDIMDGGAHTDTATYADATGAVTVSLATTGPQDTGGAGIDTLTNIERLIGSQYGDVLTGDAGNNSLTGGVGADILSGGLGDDIYYVDNIGDSVLEANDGGSDTINTSISYVLGSRIVETLVLTGTAAIDGTGNNRVNTLIGNSGNNILSGLGGDDTISGGNGNDIVIGGTGNDKLDGGAHTDTASYVDATAAVTVSLLFTLAQNTGGAGADTLAGFENLTGSQFDDRLTGDTGNNSLSGGEGADILEGGLGTDILNGGNGSDTVVYAGAQTGVTVSLKLDGNQQYTVGGGYDTLIGIEHLIGSAHDDMLTGSSANNNLSGGRGADVLDGGDGDDILNGGADIDTASYVSSTAEVAVHLGLAGPQETGRAGYDTLIGIENLLGSAYADKLTGDAGNNRIDGYDGNDMLSGGLGDDVLVGGNGTDTATYADALTGVTIDLMIAGPQDTGGMGNDSFASVESLIGSAYDDVLTGNASRNTVAGGEGDDTLHGGDGKDTLLGGAGKDKLYGDASGDTIMGGDGDDFIFGGPSLGASDYMTGGEGADQFFFVRPSSAQYDYVKDFSVTDDLVILDGSSFGLPAGTLSPDSFEIDYTGPEVGQPPAGSDVADITSPHITYRYDSGQLWYGGTPFADLSGHLDLTNANFVIV